MSYITTYKNMKDKTFDQQFDKQKVTFKTDLQMSQKVSFWNTELCF